MLKNWFKKETKLLLTMTDEYGNIKTSEITVRRGDSLDITFTARVTVEGTNIEVKKRARIDVV